MNVWKIASRWSEDGNSGSILDLFKKYNIAFVYDNEARTKIKKGDLIALSSGYQIVGVAKAIADACKVTDLKIIEEKDKERFDYSENVSAVRLNIYDLKKEGETFEYKKRGRFHLVNKDREKIIKLYEIHHEDNIGNKFSINASTHTFKGKGNKILNGVNYIIPIYQRPYSWGEKEVTKFIQDIFISYWGHEKKLEYQEPMFIGSMQLSEKKDGNKQYIIDGQQRITSFCLLIKYLQLKNKYNEIISFIDFESLLVTQVNNGTQQELYKQAINSESLKDLKSEVYPSNQYIENIKIIKSVFEEQIENHEGSFIIDSFLNHLLANIHFVVIETQAGLSKTIQIFNAINTTGLDLNGGDVFKVRMYEYLTTIKHRDDKCFTEISNLYKKIDYLNIKHKVNFSINDMLYTYRDVLVSKYDMRNVLFELNQNTFFDRLFDTILGNHKWDYFSDKASNIELSTCDIDAIIDNRYKWEEQWQKTKGETACVYHFCWHSRYSKYWNIIFTYLFKNSNVELSELDSIIKQLNKLFFLYSVSFDKVINNIKSFMHGLYKSIYSNDDFNIIESISNKLKENMQVYGEPKNRLETVLSSNIFYNAKKKYLICRLSAMLEGDVDVKLLFHKNIDIEHIQPQADKTENADEWDWDLKNSIGNLVVLERNLNRSISNDEGKKKDAYLNSRYKIVKKLSNEESYNFENWSIDECKKRLDIEKGKVISYVFG